MFSLFCKPVVEFCKAVNHFIILLNCKQAWRVTILYYGYGVVHGNLPHTQDHLPKSHDEPTTHPPILNGPMLTFCISNHLP